MRIDRLLSNFGYGTRKEIKDFIKAGRITIDGIAAKDPGTHVDPASSVVKIGDEVLNYREFIYLMLNKPAGVISATFDNKHKTVVDLIPEEYQCFDLFPVGRLDIDTEGLLIMTNDGQLSHNVLSPKKHVSKRYYALIDGDVSASDIDEMKKGLTLDDGYKTLPADLFILKSCEYSEVELVIYEGKFHQVKRMFEALGKKVKYLKRIKMGRLSLDEGLELGQSRELKEFELELLKETE